MKEILSINDMDKAIHYLEKEKDRRKELYWETKDKSLINIKDMTDSHLQNTLNFLYRRRENWDIIQTNMEEIW